LVSQASSSALARASYDGRPGHPVLLGREHWGPVREQAHGDEGARGYLRHHQVELVECGDIGSGDDVDRPDQLR
jgi:nicotine blue oxidoreductase